jgi:hypothetical protein
VVLNPRDFFQIILVNFRNHPYQVKLTLFPDKENQLPEVALDGCIPGICDLPDTAQEGIAMYALHPYLAQVSGGIIRCILHRTFSPVLEKFAILKLSEQSIQGIPAMKIRLAALLTTLSIVCLPMQSYAAKGGEQGPSDRAYERASDNASFKREGDKPGKSEYRGDKDSDDDYGHDGDGKGSSKGSSKDKDQEQSKYKDKPDSDDDVRSRDKKDKKEK